MRFHFEINTLNCVIPWCALWQQRARRLRRCRPPRNSRYRSWVGPPSWSCPCTQLTLGPKDARLRAGRLAARAALLQARSTVHVIVLISRKSINQLSIWYFLWFNIVYSCKVNCVKDSRILVQLALYFTAAFSGASGKTHCHTHNKYHIKRDE